MLKINAWFYRKEFSQMELDCLVRHNVLEEPEIVQTTEKAYKCVWTTPDGCIVRWVPKSAVKELVMSAEMQAQEDAKKRYSELIGWCKERGVKGVRSGMRIQTILEKVKGQGMPLPYGYNLRRC